MAEERRERTDRTSPRRSARDTSRGTRRRREQPSGRGGEERRRESSAEGRGRSEESPPSRKTSGLTASEAARRAAEHVGHLTGRPPEGVTSVERTEDGWRLGVEVLEAHRIPDSTDILAVYRVEMDGAGEMVSYRRDQRYYRGRTEEE